MPKHPLQQAIEDADFECQSYSGRGMYGRKCLAVEIGRSHDLGELFAGILEQVEGEDNTREIQDGLRGMCWDNMGLDMVYYFPNVPYTEDEEPEDEEEEVSGLRNIQIARLPRDGCVRLLEAAGIQCYDSESTEVLREAVAANVEDGTITPQDLEAASA
jgi:hypothetical protein